MRLISRFLGLVAAASIATAASADPVGERRLTAVDSTAALRDSQHRDQVRVTVWYPAAAGAAEKRIDLGPPEAPEFRVGAVARDAPFADQRPRPVILFSHGFGGTARMMGWFGTALARHGFVVVAVDHPGNNGADEMTTPGAILRWDRVQDLKAGLDAAKSDPAIAPHLDMTRLGSAGFSVGGYTALISAGARADLARFRDFCRRSPSDGVCLPQQEFAVSPEDAKRALASPAIAAEARHAEEDHSIAGVRAVFVIAPAVVQELTPDSLAKLRGPVAIILGDADRVAPPATNGLVAAKAIAGSQLRLLPGVGHYDFLSTCTQEGRVRLPLCEIEIPQESTHRAAIEMAESFFDKAFGGP